MTISPITRRAALAGMGALAASPALAKAPLLGVARPDFYRFKLGAFEVATILDGVIQRGEPQSIFGTDQTPEAFAALAAANFLPVDQIENGYTPVVLNTGAEVILFDTGNGAARRPGRGALREILAANGLAPEQIDIVVITHFHPDHVGGIMEGDGPAFPNARYVASRLEFDWWRANAAVRGEAFERLLESTVFAVAENMTFLEDGRDVASGVTLLAAHGHTPGHSVFHLESEGRRLMICADACNHYVFSLQRPEWHVRFDMDKEAAGRTRRRLLDMLATERTPFTGYHMPFPAIGHVERFGDAFRYAPVSYQLNL
ncbi:MAG: MBL fold metallo-hydrolase [Pseudomonadota bacterium]